jgi:hypothetical protein
LCFIANPTQLTDHPIFAEDSGALPVNFGHLSPVEHEKFWRELCWHIPRFMVAHSNAHQYGVAPPIQPRTVRGPRSLGAATRGLRREQYPDRRAEKTDKPNKRNQE